MKTHLFILSALLTTFALGSSAAVIESCTEDIAQARGVEAARSKGGLEHNQLANTNRPVRAGRVAFRHWITTRGERAELAMARTEIGGTYWYGWSLLLPADYDLGGSRSLVMQLATYPTPRNGKFPCSANGSYLAVGGDGKLTFFLQHKGEDRDMVCEQFTILEDVSKLRGKWLDFVMHAKWTGDPDGFLRFWVKADDNNYFQRINYTGRTFWNDEDKGPYFKMGLYTGEPGWRGGPERVVFTDEYRLGDAASSFNDVAPGADARHRGAKNGRFELLTYPSALNGQEIVIGVYTPPGYESGAQRYPVVYNLHGAGGGSPTRQWERAGSTIVEAIESGTVGPMIYVFVNGLGDTFYVDYAKPAEANTADKASRTPLAFTAAPQVESSIMRELIPFIDARYRTIASRSGRAVDGFSMGGAGALMLAMKHPDQFSSVVAYGGALIQMRGTNAPAENSRWPTPEHFAQFSAWGALEQNPVSIRDQLRIRLICGGDDRLLGTNERFKARLDELGIPAGFDIVPGVAHDTEGLYRRRGGGSLRFIEAGFSRSASPQAP